MHGIRRRWRHTASVGAAAQAVLAHQPWHVYGGASLRTDLALLRSGLFLTGLLDPLSDAVTLDSR